MNEYRTTELNELFSALAKAQGEIESAHKTSDNPFFKSKYADLAEVIGASRPSLAKYGLSVSQTIDFDEVSQVLITILAHSSGQMISSRTRIQPQKSDIQAFGSYVTYLRRYSYAALVGVVADEDDDGERAMARITKEQEKELDALIGNDDNLYNEFLKKAEIKKLPDLVESKFQAAIDWVIGRKNKKKEERINHKGE